MSSKRKAKNDGGSWDSVFDLMNNLRDDAIDRTREEIDRRTNDTRFEVVVIGVFSRRRRRHSRGGRSLSVYIGAWNYSGNGNSFSEDGAELMFRVRLSDHKPKERAIWLDVNDMIHVWGDNGVDCKWGDLDWKTQKVDLFEGRDTALSKNCFIVNAKFSISRSDQGGIVNKCRNKIIDSIYEVFDGIFDSQAGGKV